MSVQRPIWRHCALNTDMVATEFFSCCIFLPFFQLEPLSHVQDSKSQDSFLFCETTRRTSDSKFWDAVTLIEIAFKKCTKRCLGNLFHFLLLVSFRTHSVCSQVSAAALWETELQILKKSSEDKVDTEDVGNSLYYWLYFQDVQTFLTPSGRVQYLCLFSNMPPANPDGHSKAISKSSWWCL